MHRLLLAGWALTVALSAGVAFRVARVLRRGSLPLTPLDSAASPTGSGDDRAFEDLLAEVAGVVDLIDAEPPAAADPRTLQMARTLLTASLGRYGQP